MKLALTVAAVPAGLALAWTLLSMDGKPGWGNTGILLLRRGLRLARRPDRRKAT